MRIESVHLPKEMTAEIEMTPIEMNKLAEVVILTGKNGSGKTRLLKLMNEVYQKTPNVETVKNIQNDIAQTRIGIRDEEERIRSWQSIVGTGARQEPVPEIASENKVLKVH